MIQVLYHNIESMLKVIGGLSVPFNISRGIRQGCALSGMLYSVAIEPMLAKLQDWGFIITLFRVTASVVSIC